MGKREIRKGAILRLLGRDGRVSTADVAIELGVTSMTIRRDLEELEAEGFARRIHGGARLRERSPFERRRVDLELEKAAIARSAAALVQDGETVAIDSGTTAHAVARELATRTGLQVITNSVHAAAEFKDTPNSVILLGGRMLPEMSMVGPVTVRALANLSANRLFLGCGGITVSRGFTYFDIEETEVRRALVSVSDNVVVVADHRKFGRTEAVSLLPFDSPVTVVTDRVPDRDLYESLLHAEATLVSCDQSQLH